MKVRFWKIHFSMKKGSIEKYKPLMKYINRYYKPHWLQINQMTWYDLWDRKPVPVIEFVAAAFDALHLMDDFLEKYPSVTVTGGAEPYEFTKIPRKAMNKLPKRFLKQMAERKKRELLNAILYKNLYKQRLARDKNKAKKK